MSRVGVVPYMTKNRITAILGNSPGSSNNHHHDTRNYPTLAVASWAALTHFAPGRNGRGYATTSCS